VWFTARDAGGGSAIHAVTLSGKRRLVARMDGRVVLEDIFRDGRVLLKRINERVGVVALPPGETRERDRSWLDGSNSADLSANGKILLLTESLEAGGVNRSAYLRKTDGSPAVRLGDGGARALSADGKWVVGQLPGSPPKLVLLPTGAGETRVLRTGLVSEYRFATWFPDGRRLLIAGNEPGRAVRCYIQDLEGGAPHPITPEGTTIYSHGHSVSPDGRFVAALSTERRLTLYPVDGGDPLPLPGLDSRDRPIRWSEDGRYLYVSPPGVRSVKVYRLDLATQKKELWKAIAPADQAGLDFLGYVQITPNAKAYAYTYSRVLSDLYLVEVLK
jgi:hypothetical protein